MSLKNIIAIALIVLTLGVLFTGCGKSVEADTEDSVGVASSDNQQSSDNNPTPESEDSEVNQVVEDDLDDEVEIGSLI